VLVLKRKRGESIMINDCIEIRYLETDQGQARLGIVAPRAVPVHRKEIYLAIQRENLAAANSSDLGLVLPGDLATWLKHDNNSPRADALQVPEAPGRAT